MNQTIERNAETIRDEIMGLVREDHDLIQTNS